MRPAAEPSAASSVRPLFRQVPACWICGGTNLTRFHEFPFDYTCYAEQDPELHAYTGSTAWLVRCGECGFAQPDTLPTLPRFFDRMYDQRWSPQWIEREFEAEYKDLIFSSVLSALRQRRQGRAGRLLDIGAHAGRFMHLAQLDGWEVEGLELNPRTAAYAARQTGAPVHRVNAQTLGLRGQHYHAVTLTDVLEQIPEPVGLLTSIARLVEPGGWIAVKVPCGASQWWKERTLAAVHRSRRVSLADNLVQVNHFSPRSLKHALERTGFTRVTIQTAPPELLPMDSAAAVVPMAGNGLRLAVYAAGRLPGALHTPLALHLQAFAQRPFES
jgi:SAM-dependent methyltransferase